MRFFIKLLVVLFFLGSRLSGQESFGGAPLNMEKTQLVPYYVLPLFNAVAWERDSIRDDMLKNMLFAKAFPVKIDVYSFSKKIHFGHQTTYQMGITSKGAYSLNIYFAEYDIPEGVKLFVYNVDRTDFRGSFTRGSSQINEMSVSPVAGDSIIIEVQVPDGIESGKLVIGRIGHDYKDVLGSSQKKDSRYNLSGSCEFDINCPLGDGWEEQQRAVCRIFFNSDSYCTGTLINNTQFDGIPYVITANHCINTVSAANSAIFVWGYESPTCDGADGKTSKSIAGSTLIATIDNLDFALVRLNKAPPFTYYPYYVGWDRTTSAPYSCTAIHHPQGDVMKISKDNNSAVTGNFGEGYDANSHWKISNWEYGTTEKGSSGCPLFNQNRRFVGNLTGGEATCSNSVNDYFAKLNRSWSDYLEENHQLKRWLDPINSGITSISGYDPVKDRCDTLQSFNSLTSKLLNKDTLQWGYVSGHNSDSAIRFAEKIEKSGRLYISSIYYDVSKAKYESFLFSKVKICLWGGDSIPKNRLYSKEIRISQIVSDATNILTVDSIIKTDGSFFVGYEISYQYKDTLAVFQDAPRNDSTSNSFYIFKNNQWNSYYDIYQKSSSLRISIFGCDTLPPSEITELKKPKENKLLVFPNPVASTLNFEISNSIIEPYQYSIMDIQGSFIDKGTLDYSDSKIDVSYLKNGLYILQLFNKNSYYTAKFIKQ